MAACTVWPTLTEKVWRREKSRSGRKAPRRAPQGQPRSVADSPSRRHLPVRQPSLPLEAIKAHAVGGSTLDGLILLRQPRLSVQPVSEPHFRVLNDLYQQLQGGEGEEDADGGGGGGAGWWCGSERRQR